MKSTKVLVSDELALNHYLMHPAGESDAGDPNPAYHLDGVSPLESTDFDTGCVRILTFLMDS